MAFWFMLHTVFVFEFRAKLTIYNACLFSSLVYLWAVHVRRINCCKQYKFSTCSCVTMFREQIVCIEACGVYMYIHVYVHVYLFFFSQLLALSIWYICAVCITFSHILKLYIGKQNVLFISNMLFTLPLHILNYRYVQFQKLYL